MLERVGLTPDMVAPVLAGLPIPLVQLRGKGTGGEFFRFCALWMPLLRQHAPALNILINDRVDLALALNADGVHVGQTDLPVAVCRRLLGPNRLIGLSTHTVEEIHAAHGADYLGFGPIYPTTTKADAEAVRGIAALAEACAAASVPVAAIGGIETGRLGEVRGAGAALAAMIGGVWLGNWRENLKQAAVAALRNP